MVGTSILGTWNGGAHPQYLKWPLTLYLLMTCGLVLFFAYQVERRQDGMFGQELVAKLKGAKLCCHHEPTKSVFFNGSTCLVFFQLFCRGAARLRMETQSSFFWFQSYWEINPQQGDMMTKVEFLQNLQCFKLDHLNGCVITVFCRGYIPTFLWKSH